MPAFRPDGRPPPWRHVATSSKATRADVSEIDLYEAATNMTQENNALARAQQSYSMISKTTLFDYL